jgi:hypothetical protein
MSTNNDDTGRAPASAEALSGLAREVDALRGKIRPVEGLATQVTELANMVADLADDMAARNRRGELLAPSWLALPWRGQPWLGIATASATDTQDGGGEDAAQAGEVGVVGVDPDALADLLEQLIQWVRRVFLAYPDAAGSFPECWLWHPAAIEELLWLWHAWQAAYVADGASARLVGDWHDRFRPGVVRRIKANFDACSLANHASSGPQGNGPRSDEAGESAGVGMPFAESGREMAGWWAAGQQGAGPLPSAGQLEVSANRWRTGRAGGRR